MFRAGRPLHATQSQLMSAISAIPNTRMFGAENESQGMTDTEWHGLLPGTRRCMVERSGGWERVGTCGAGASSTPCNPAVSLKSLKRNCPLENTHDRNYDGQKPGPVRTLKQCITLWNNKFHFSLGNWISPCLFLLREVKCLYFLNHLEDSLQEARKKRFGDGRW